ncbi:AraC-type DNA-binding protein [Klenkia marina]|uniref:AraC-type DNA-binding protein n=1 Tax=Klenkia marina TaxID=1960309 RepID=A0A1G4XSL3_9ACTN|nr:helix-turn-helix domain-containing protein [Klenkia marina]SCX44201.1 AraC-type DNA-binding protein [Klenkia marina]
MHASGPAQQVLTCGAAGPEAFEHWRALISDTFVPLTAVPTTDRPFRGELRVVTHPAVQLTEVRSHGQHVRRTRQLIAGSSEDYLLSSIQLGGRGRVEQDGRTAVLTPGAMTFYDSTRPYTLHFDDAFEQLVVQLPRRPLLAAAGVPDDGVHLTAVALEAGGPGSVLAGFFSSLALVHDRDPAGALQLSAHAPALLASALRLAAGQGAGPDDAGLARERVLAHLRRHAGDPHLDADAVATACHLSRRALFRLFEGRESLASALRRTRVERAAELLVAQPRRPVASVGTACGFAGEAQFHRAFRQVTGMTPAEHRAGTHGR